jgi:hypothetical protein
VDETVEAIAWKVVESWRRVRYLSRNSSPLDEEHAARDEFLVWLNKLLDKFPDAGPPANTPTDVERAAAKGIFIEKRRG